LFILQVGSKLQLDMEKAGIHLRHDRQARMQELMGASNHFAAKFNAALVRARWDARSTWDGSTPEIW